MIQTHGVAGLEWRLNGSACRKSVSQPWTTQLRPPRKKQGKTMKSYGPLSFIDHLPFQNSDDFPLWRFDQRVWTRKTQISDLICHEVYIQHAMGKIYHSLRPVSLSLSRSLQHAYTYLSKTSGQEILNSILIKGSECWDIRQQYFDDFPAIKAPWRGWISACESPVLGSSHLNLKSLGCLKNPKSWTREQHSTTLTSNITPRIPQMAQQLHTFRGFLSHRGTPVHHPLIDGIFHEINHQFCGELPPFLETPYITNENYGAGSFCSIEMGWWSPSIASVSADWLRNQLAQKKNLISRFPIDIPLVSHW